MANITTSSGRTIRMAITTSDGGTYHLYAQWTTSGDDEPTPTPPTLDRDRDRDRDNDNTPVDDNPDETIDDGDTPLAPGTIDEDTDETIDDEATPLTPLTGDDRHTAAWGFLNLLSLAGIVVLGKRRKEEE